jgi:pimeloyl-ACP methyl ester carboxylesterase
MNQTVPHSDQAFEQVNGVTIAYDTFGNSSSPPLLLIQGLGAQLINWREEFCSQIAARGYWVIRFDSRDVGLSTSFDEAGVPNIAQVTQAQQRGKAIQTPYTLHDMADDTMGLLDALHIESAHVLGVSMGGRIAQIMAIRHSHRMSTLTSIMSTMGDPGYPPPNPEAYKVLLMPAPKNRAGYIEYYVQIAQVLSGSGFSPDEDRVRERAGRAFDRRFNPAGVARQMAALMATGSVKNELRDLKVPTLVIHGTDDPLIPVECARDIAHTIPGAKLLIIEGMGHALSDIPQIWPEVIGAVAHHAVERVKE